MSFTSAMAAAMPALPKSANDPVISEELLDWLQPGIHFNFTYDEISPLLGVDPKDMMDTIKAIGPQHFTLSSDGGNPLLPGAVDALATLVRYARAYGLSDAEIHQMTVENPRQVLGMTA